MRPVLAQRNPKEAGKAVVNALADRDGKSDGRPWEPLMYSIEVPTDTLVGLVYSDASATIRAMRSRHCQGCELSADTSIAPIAQQAIDSDVNVQT
jgi:hypothetical protein